MIARISGKLVEKGKNSVILENNGVSYEVFLPVITLSGIEANTDGNVLLHFITYHYYQLEPSRGIPVLIGFLNQIEKEFFEVFITVSGIGPKAALRALNMPVSEIARAIDEGDTDFLRSLPGIGPQRAKEIIAKLQGKIGKFGLMQSVTAGAKTKTDKSLVDEAVDVLMQLQYKKNEAREMVQDALKKQPNCRDLEELLNLVYKQKIQKH